MRKHAGRFTILSAIIAFSGLAAAAASDEAKYTPGGSEHVLPAHVSEAVAKRCMELAVKAHKSLGCRGVTRSDFRYDESTKGEQVYFLEINTQPGMTATSLTPEQAAYNNIPFPDLCQWIIEDASCQR